jgi:ubiquitin-protein ligase
MNERNSDVGETTRNSETNFEKRKHMINNGLSEKSLKLQRKQRLEMLYQKRKFNIEYIRKVHEGDSCWFDCLLITKDDIQKLVTNVVPKQRVLNYFYLGLSLSKILELTSGSQIIRAILQLIEEWEYYFSGPGIQGMKFVMAKSCSTLYPKTSPIIESDGTEIFRPNIYKFNGSVVFEHLLDPIFPFDLEYVEVLLSLSSTLLSLYDTFIKLELYNNATTYEAILKIDNKIKFNFINLIAKEITDFCMSESSNEIELFGKK